MSTHVRLLPLLLLLTLAPLRGAGSLEHARRAQALLGRETWSQVIRIENSAHASRYPKTLYALVFELAGLLWFYSDVDGTQSFSLHLNRLEEEKADFAPLLRDIEPGFRRWSIVPDAAPAAAGGELALPKGCFIESVAALRMRVALGAPASNARLVSYYVQTPAGVTGHTVLAYDVDGSTEVLDPTRSERAFVLPRGDATTPLAIARAIDRSHVVKARQLPLRQSASTMIASNVTSAAAHPRDSVRDVADLAPAAGQRL